MATSLKQGWPQNSNDDLEARICKRLAHIPKAFGIQVFGEVRFYSEQSAMTRHSHSMLRKVTPL